ncbi:MAG: hypothetical protein JO166_08615 [Deltaproteobacteria bacterium]|nr:hypothetical protein [Deltaproteobacteria bacterium]
MTERGESRELAVIGPAGAPAPLPMPAASVIVLRQTPNAAFAAEEFFKATLNNEHTRRAYGCIAGRFLAWCNDRGLELRQITPGARCSNCDRPTSNDSSSLCGSKLRAIVRWQEMAFTAWPHFRIMLPVD